MNAHRELDYFVAIVTDIQARHAAESSLAALRHELENRIEERTCALRTANEMLSYSLAQQVRFQQALCKREAELSAVIEHANDAYISIDQAGGAARGTARRKKPLAGPLQTPLGGAWRN